MAAIAAACGPRPTPWEPPPPVELDGPTLMDATAELLDVGPRLVGTPAEVEATDVVVRLFQDAGMQDVRREAFVWDAWQPGTAAVEVAGARYPAEPLSPTPPLAGVTGLLALETDADVTDRIVIATSAGTSRGAQVLLLRAAGAAGMVRVSERHDDEDGGPLVEVGHTFVGVRWPSLAVDADVGAELRAHVGEPATVTAASEVLEGHTSWNVVGDIPGTGPGLVIVTAHLDSWHLSESAADNALGVGAMVVMARKLAEGAWPTATVRFVATGGEEQGLQGALAYVQAHPVEAGSAQLLLNLDVMWSPEGTFVVMSDEDRWTDLALDTARAEGIQGVDGGSPNPSSDNFPFQIAGSPAFWAGRFGWREYHTRSDLLERLEPEEAAASLRVQWAVLASEAYGPR
ncbi:MAG: M28 family peptidase [Myxococcales bacterium]|nr:M28 family peptidase [Myxococcales bacterium]